MGEKEPGEQAIRIIKTGWKTFDIVVGDRPVGYIFIHQDGKASIKLYAKNIWRIEIDGC